MEKAKGQSNHHVTAEEDRVPLFQKLIYGMGAIANDGQAAWLGQMVAILILGLGIPPYIAGLIGFFPRIFDAVLDPIIGFSSDNARTKYGRRRPFIFWGAIAAGISYMLMFQLYNENGAIFNGWYFLIFQVIFFAAFTCFSIPWNALGYELTPDYHERTSVQSWRGIMAQISWLVSPWCWAIVYNKNWFSDPETGEADIVLGVRVFSIIIGASILIGGILPAIFNKERFANLPKPQKILGNYLKNLEANSWRFVMQCFAFSSVLAFCFSFYIPFGALSGWAILWWRLFFTILGGATITIIFLFLYAHPILKNMFNNIALTLKIKEFVKICAATFLIYNGFMLSSTFILYVIWFYVFKNAPHEGLAINAGSKLLGLYGTFSAICTVIVISFIPKLSRKFGKRGAFFITIPLSIVGYATKWFAYKQVHPADSKLWTMLEGSGVANFFQSCWFIIQHHWLILACAPFIVFGLGSLFTIMLSMMGEVCDLDELKTGERREGMFSAVFWWTIKMGFAISGLLGGAMLTWTHFERSAGIYQQASTTFGMRALDVGIPIVTSAIAMLIIMTFKMTEEKAHQLREKLEARRGKA
jgi:GPH family glycoside/pentoside/hexuronide:cation symporter